MPPIVPSLAVARNKEAGPHTLVVGVVSSFWCEMKRRQGGGEERGAWKQLQK